MSIPPTLPLTAPFAEEQIAALNKVFATTNAEQRIWLSGFLAGFQAASAPAALHAATMPAAAPAAAAQPKAPLTILFATESGNSEALADEARKAAGKLGFSARLLDMAEADLNEIAKAKNLLVIASTWGEGDPPERAAEFYHALMGEGAPRFDGVRFAVLALGDTAYVNFCEIGRRIDARLAALGGARVAERVECDVDYEAQATAWIKGTLDTLKEQSQDDAPAAGSVIHVDFAHGDLAAPTASLYGKANPFAAEITELVTLTSSRSSKETVHVELSLAGSGLGYEPGDALGIAPQNDPLMVEAVLDAVGLGGDAALHRALSQSHDITTLSRPLIEAYAKLTGDRRIAALLDPEALPGFLAGRQVVDLFEAFPHQLRAEQLTKLLRPLPPRLYSIASSLKMVPEEAHILVAAVRYESHGRARGGVASTYLADRRRIGETLKVHIKPNKHFRLPSDPDRPIIMVGPGTGVAPFRAFLQEREAIGAKGKSWLFFGERNFTHDFLYQLEWQDMLKSGALDRIDLAFSRDQPEKIYVQQRLWERRAELFTWLEEGAHLYVCGDEKQMAKDVQAMLERIIADQSGRDLEATAAYLSALRREGRYQRDVY